jgi:hypothetical protein
MSRRKNTPVRHRPVADGGIGSPRSDRRDAEQRRTADISPLYADLHGLPPAPFSVGALEPMRDDSLFMPARWAGVRRPTVISWRPKLSRASQVTKEPDPGPTVSQTRRQQVTIALTSDRDPLAAWLAREQGDCFSCSHLMIAGLRRDTSVATANDPRERVQRYALGVDASGEANPGWTSRPRGGGHGVVFARAIARSGP